MAKAIRESTKKRGRPKTTGKGKPFTIRLHPPLLTALEEWAANHGCTKTEALRQLAELGMEVAAKRKR